MMDIGVKKDSKEVLSEIMKEGFSKEEQDIEVLVKSMMGLIIKDEGKDDHEVEMEGIKLMEEASELGKGMGDVMERRAYLALPEVHL